MEKETIGTMQLVGVPKEFRPNKHEHKSPWAVIIILIALLGAGAFFFIKTQTPPPPTPPSVSQQEPSIPLGDLEASAGDIIIPDYTDIL